MNLEKYVNEFKNGNQKAFDIIYKETFSFVRLAIYKYVQNKDIVDDLIQDVYTKISSNISSYSSSNFKNYIYTMAKNIAIDYVRRKKESVLENPEFIPDNQTHPYLAYVINHLDDTLREVFLMKVLYGHTTRKIAEILNKKPSEINQMYYQAKQILKKNLKEVPYEA